jgi:hypothetical protein
MEESGVMAEFISQVVNMAFKPIMLNWLIVLPSFTKFSVLKRGVAGNQ